MPKLVNLSINNSNIVNIDLRCNFTLEKLVFGVNQKFLVLCQVELLFFNDLPVPSTQREPNTRMYSTARYHLLEFVSLGVGYEALIFKELLQFKTNPEENF